MSPAALDRAAGATAAVFAAGQRRGSGVRVGTRHVLTAAHVIRKADTFAVIFPGAGADPLPATLTAVASPELDVALLAVEDLPEDPEPAPLSPIARVPERVKVFGFPLAEAALKGVWRDLSCSGRTGRLVQGDWVNADAGSMVGHSGGPVIDATTGALVGVIVEGAERGRFDRFAPLSEVRAELTDVRVPWLFAGEEARGHFERRARGQRSVARGGDLFRGRRAALDAIDGWLRSPAGTDQPMVITGQPGSGKSAVLARAALGIERDGVGPGLAFHARRSVTADLVDAVAALTGLDTPASWQSLVAELGSHDAAPSLILVVDGLDEAGSDEDLREMRQLLRELARLGAVRIAVATRPLASGDRFRPGSHLHALGAGRGADSPNLIDLDADRYFEIDDLIAFAGGMLCQDGADRPGPPGSAWSRYRAEPHTTEGLARVIAERAGRNYLVAAMAAFDLSESPATVDPSTDGFDPDSIPAGVGEALEGYLQRLDAEVRERTRGLLTALAYARGSGLDDDRWRSFVDALGFGAASAADLARLRQSGAADYLLESKPESGQAVTRLFHQALADELRAGRVAEADESLIVDVIVAEAQRNGWIAAPGYVRRHAADHAAAAGRLEELVGDPAFLVAADPQTLLPELSRLPAENPLPGFYRLGLEMLSDDAAMNAAVLELVTRVQGEIAVADALAQVPAGHRPFSPVAVVCRPLAVAAGEFHGHTARLTAITRTRWPGMPHDVAVTTSADGTARVWDPLSTDAELTRIERGALLLGVAATQWPGSDYPRIAIWSMDNELSIWDPAEPERPIASYQGYGVAAATWIALETPATPVLAVGFLSGEVGVLDPLEDEEPNVVYRMHADYVAAIARLRLPDIEHDIVVTGATDGTMALWDPLGAADLPGYDIGSPIAAVTGIERRDGTWYLVVGTRNAACVVWDPASDEDATVLRGHTNTVRAAAPVPWPGHDDPMLATTSTDETTRVWDVLEKSELLRFEGHTEPTVGVVALEMPANDGTLIATASNDGTARLWDRTALARAGQRFAGHEGAVHGLAVVDDPARPQRLLITTSLDRTARVWALDDPRVEVGRFDGHTHWVWDVTTVAAADGRLVAVSVGADCVGRVWDPERPTEELGCFELHEAPIWGVRALRLPELDHDVVVTCSPDTTARIWDPLDPETELARFEGHTEAVWQATTLELPGVGHPVVVTTSFDDTARVWDPLDPSVELARFEEHEDDVRSVAVLRYPGIDHDVLVTTSIDGTARIWDPLAPDESLAVYAGHETALGGVTTVTRPDGGGQLRLATASFDGTLRIWLPTEPERTVLTIALLGQGYSLLEAAPGRLIAATTRGFLILDVA